MNDLLTACWGQTNVDKLKLDYTPEDLTRAEEAIIKVLSPHRDLNEYYFKVLNIAVEKLK